MKFVDDDDDDASFLKLTDKQYESVRIQANSAFHPSEVGK